MVIRVLGQFQYFCLVSDSSLLNNYCDGRLRKGLCLMPADQPKIAEKRITRQAILSFSCYAGQNDCHLDLSAVTSQECLSFAVTEIKILLH